MRHKTKGSRAHAAAIAEAAMKSDKAQEVAKATGAGVYWLNAADARRTPPLPPFRGVMGGPRQTRPGSCGGCVGT